MKELLSVVVAVLSVLALAAAAALSWEMILLMIATRRLPPEARSGLSRWASLWTVHRHAFPVSKARYRIKIEFLVLIGSGLLLVCAGVLRDRL